jgi:putative endonuclease
MKKITTTEIGIITEAFAQDFLAEQGLRFLTKNFHSYQGEIDLLMQDQHTLVFVEVKYRKHNSFGGAISAVSYKKQQKIKQCAAFYLQKSGLNEYNTPCRFDVIALTGHINQLQVTWLKNAF